MEKALHSQPRSVILVGQYRLWETNRCLASLAEDPDFASWDVLLVDAILGQYGKQAEGGSPPPALRIANRLKLASLDVPRSFLKRWRCLRKVAALQKRRASCLEHAKSTI